MVLGERLSFSDSEASYDSETEPPLEGKAVAPGAGRQRRPRRRRRRRNTDGSMAAARRSQPAIVGLSQASRPNVAHDRRPSPPVAHPARATGAADEDGFYQVQSRRRWRRRTRPRQSKHVPPNLVGKCFNCMGEDHVRAQCVNRSRCLNCGSECHRRRDCPFPEISTGRPTTRKRRRSPDWRGGHRLAVPCREPFTERRRPAHPDDTISGGPFPRGGPHRYPAAVRPLHSRQHWGQLQTPQSGMAMGANRPRRVAVRAPIQQLHMMV
jgi:hypothetical protein